MSWTSLRWLVYRKRAVGQTGLSLEERKDEETTVRCLARACLGKRGERARRSCGFLASECKCGRAFRGCLRGGATYVLRGESMAYSRVTAGQCNFARGPAPVCSARRGCAGLA